MTPEIVIPHKPRFMPLSKLSPEPTTILLNQSGDGYILGGSEQGVPLRELASPGVLGEVPQYDGVVDMEAVLGVGTSFTTNLERISRIRRNRSWENRTRNRRARTPAEMERFKKKGWYVCHVTINVGFKNGPKGVLEYMLGPHPGPNGTTLVPSAHEVAPAVPTAFINGQPVWELFSYVSDDQVANQAGRGHVVDPITGDSITDTMNFISTSIEVDNDGRTPIIQEQFDMLVMDVVEFLRQGGDIRRVIGHKDWAPGRKFDPQAVCYLVQEVRDQAMAIWEILNGHQPEKLPTGRYMTRRDGFRTNVRQDYHNASSPIALKLDPGTQFDVDQTYTDGALVNGTRRWVHIGEVEYQNRTLRGPGFASEVRVIPLETRLLKLLPAQATLSGKAEATYLSQKFFESRRVLVLSDADVMDFTQDAMCG